MATNDNQGNNNNGHITFTGTPDIKNGISGWQQNRAAQSDFSNSFWKDKGYLSESIKELESMEKLYEDMSTIVDKMTKTQKKAYEANLDALQRQLSYLKDIKTTGEVSDKEAIEAIKSSNALRLKGQNDFIKVLKDGIVTQEIADKNHVKSVDDAARKYNQIKEDSSTIGKKLNNTAKLLEKSGKTLADSLTETLDKAGDKLANLSNMFNLQRIANNSMEQNARSKASIVGNISRQFGFTNNSQFESFKNSLNDTIKQMNRDMGSLFNSEDIKNYMANISTYGITSTDIAQQQMRSSILAEKYLGVSAETQTQIFKYMKRTNDYEMLDKHNRTITSLLKSQLGVSKEQLDALSQIAYTTVDDLAAIGMSQQAQEAFTRTNIASGAVLSSMNGIGDNSAKAISQLYSSFLTSTSDQLGNWAPILGNTNIVALQDKARYGNTEEQQVAAFREFLQAIQSSEAMSGDMRLAETIQKMVPNFNSAAINGIRNLNLTDFTNQLTEELKNINLTTNSDVSSFVEQSQEATWLEKIFNNLDTFINGLPWKFTMNLANLAFTAYLASDLIKGGKWVVDSFKPTGWIGKIFKSSKVSADATKSLAGGTGVGGEGLGKLASGAAVVGLTATAISGIVAAADALVQKDYNAGNSNQSYYLNKQKGTAFEGDTGRAYTSGVANSHGYVSNSNGKDKGERFGSYFSLGNFAQNLAGSAANGLVGWFNNFNKGDPVKYNTELWNNWMRETHGLFTDEEFQKLMYIYSLLMYDMGSPSVAENLFKLNAKSIGTWLNSYGTSEEGLNNLVSDVQWGLNKFYANNIIPVTHGKKKWTGGISNIKDWWNDSAQKWYTTGPQSGQGGPAGDYIPLQSITNGKGGDNTSWTSMIHSPWYKVTSMWGNRPNPFGGGNTENHGGIDIAAPEGTPIGSAVNGTVYTAGWVSGFGNAVYIQGDNGMKYIYGHMVKQPSVKTGQSVKAGQVIGYVGSTGRSTGNHLHFQVGTGWTKAQSKDPVPYLNTGVLYPGGEIKGITGYTSSSSTNNTESAAVNNVKYKRFVPKSFGNATDNAGGPADGASRIVGSVDGGFRNLINYLDSIREEQSTQRAILEAFSKSRMSESSFS